MAVQSKDKQVQTSDYALYMEAEFNRPESYPLVQKVDLRWYRPVAPWLGRLLLPQRQDRSQVLGALLEIHHAPEAYGHLIGQTVWLRWARDPEVNVRHWGVTQQVIFNEQSHKLVAGGFVLPERLDSLPYVNPFESLAGSHPHDDIFVRLAEPVEVEAGHGAQSAPVLYIAREPVQVTGRYYALVRFAGPAEGGDDLYTVVHYAQQTGGFTGSSEVVRLPLPIANREGIYPAVSKGIENAPANHEGWYIYGAQDAGGVFVVQALAPRGLMRVAPQRIIRGQSNGEAYIKPAGWKAESDKGTFATTLVCPDGADPDSALAKWREGEQALVIHLYGGIGGKKRESAARARIYWGHFSFGTAEVIREPLAGELVFDIVYHQVYVHNPDGLPSGALHWARYSGDRQFGWMGSRPIQEILVKLDCFTQPFDFGTICRSALETLVYQLEVMTARYRIADGRGGLGVTASHNCAQDSSQALYAAIKRIQHTVTTRADILAWRETNPEEAQRLDRLLALGEELRRVLLPWGTARADWEWNAALLGSSLSQKPLKNITVGLRSWRTLLPSVAVRTLAKVFLKHGASLWVLRTNQVGGHDPDIEPVIPNI